MLHNIKGFVAFFAAMLGIASSIFYYYYFQVMYTDPHTALDSLGFTFSFVSACLWVVYAILYFITAAQATPKKKK